MANRYGAIEDREFLLHGTYVSLKGEGYLIIGSSGSGKTSLGLAAEQSGGEVVADDSVRFLKASGKWFGTSAFGGPRVVRIRAIVQLNTGYDSEVCSNFLNQLNEKLDFLDRASFLALVNNAHDMEGKG